MDKFIDISISFNAVFTQCQKLSSYEGREAVTATGDSDYLKVHMTDQDKKLVYEYIAQAAHELETALGSIVQSSAISDEGISISFGPVSGYRGSRTTLVSMTQEAISSWVMSQWCQTRLPQRVEAYQVLFTEMVKSCISNIHSYPLPTKRRRSISNNNDVITMS